MTVKHHLRLNHIALEQSKHDCNRKGEREKKEKEKENPEDVGPTSVVVYVPCIYSHGT